MGDHASIWTPVICTIQKCVLYVSAHMYSRAAPCMVQPWGSVPATHCATTLAMAVAVAVAISFAVTMASASDRVSSPSLLQMYAAASAAAAHEPQ